MRPWHDGRFGPTNPLSGRPDREAGAVSAEQPPGAPLGEGGRAWVDAAVAEFAQTRDPALRREIVARSTWLAHRMARRFADTSEPYDDLYQVAMIGLLKAIDRFDPTFGVRFGSFASPTILGELRRHFRDHTWAVQVPRRAQELRIRINAAMEPITAELGRSPTVPELAAHLRVSREDVLEGLEADGVYASVSLDGLQGIEPIDDDRDGDQVLDRRLLATLLDRLPARERRILYLRYVEELSQAQIAQRVGTSQVHVGRLITASLCLLREYAGTAPS